VLTEHDRQHVLARHHHATQVDGYYLVERVAGDLRRRAIADGQTDSHVVVQDVDTAEPANCLFDNGLDVPFHGDVGWQRHRGAALRPDGAHRGLGGTQIAVHGDHARTLPAEQHRRSPAVADGLTGCLARPDNNRHPAI
jgi:hypothetical protein